MLQKNCRKFNGKNTGSLKSTVYGGEVARALAPSPRSDSARSLSAWRMDFLPFLTQYKHTRKRTGVCVYLWAFARRWSRDSSILRGAIGSSTRRNPTWTDDVNLDYSPFQQRHCLVNAPVPDLSWEDHNYVNCLFIKLE